MMPARPYQTELKFHHQANVYAIIQSEEQANIVVEQLENAILQLDQIDEWLVHYTHVLDVSLSSFSPFCAALSV